MEWTKRQCVGFTMNAHPAEEWHAQTEDGHTLVAMLQDDRHRGGGRGIITRLYGEDPCAPVRQEATTGAPARLAPIAPRRMPTLEEIRAAVDQVAPAGSYWLLGMGQTMLQAKGPGAEYPLASVWTEGPLLCEVQPNAQAGPAIIPASGMPAKPNGGIRR